MGSRGVYLCEYEIKVSTEKDGVRFLESNRREKGNRTFYIVVGIIILVLLSLYTLFMMWVGGGYLEEGIAGYITHIVKRVILIIVAGGLLVYSYRRIESRKGALLWLLFLCISLFFCFIFLRNIILDIPYISKPECTRLRVISWDVDTEMDYYIPYKIEGLDEDGKKRRFTVNKSTYKRYSGEDSINIADVMYLPRTRVVMKLDMGDAGAEE